MSTARVGIPEQDEVSNDIVLGRLRAFNGWACGIVWRQRSPHHVVGVSEMGAEGLPVTQLTAKEWLALPRCT